MRTLGLISLVCTAALLMSCSSLTVRTDFDPEYDFNTFKTYRWAATKELNPDDALAQDPLTYKRVVAAVDKALAEKGFKLVDSEDFDFVVLAHAGVKERMQVHNTGMGYGGWYDPWWGPYGGTTHVSHYEEGTLVIDIVHWEKKELAWRGMGTGIVGDVKNQEKAQKDIDIVCAKILADFPPAAASK